MIDIIITTLYFFLWSLHFWTTDFTLKFLHRHKCQDHANPVPVAMNFREWQ